MLIVTLRLGALGTNCYLAAASKGAEAAVLDPVDDAPLILETAKENDLKITHILLTHGHFDHIMGLSELKRLTDAKVYVHKDDAPMLADAESCLATHLGLSYESAKADILLSGGEEIEVGALKFRVIHVVGHTAGGVCYYSSEADDRVIFTGDTLFAGSIGRTDLSGSSVEILRQNIMNGLFVLPDETRVFPGHGEQTTIGFEKKNNPFFV